MQRIIKKLNYWAQEKERVAVCVNGESMTYAEIEEKSNALAAYFIENLKVDKSPVGIYGDKENEIIAVMFAASKSGRPYMFLPSYYPQDRIESILKVKMPEVIVALDGHGYDFGTFTMNADDTAKVYKDYKGRAPSEDNYVSGDDIASIIFTSGSTGLPKGVKITAKNISAMVDWRNSVGNVYPENSTIASVSPYSFSVHLSTVHLLMIDQGVKICNIPKKDITDFPKLIKTVIDSDPYLLGGSPAFLEILFKSDKFCGENMKSLKYFSTGGEPLSGATAKELKRRFPDPKVEIWNFYGATELAAGGVHCQYTDDIIERDAVLPTGIPDIKANARLVDEDGNDVPDGEAGELVISSDMVALGYIDLPEKEKEVFFVDKDGRRGYRTHDIMRKERGLLYFVGRSDNIIKVGGNRVEAEEVERAVVSLEGVSKCIVVPAMRDNIAELMVAYVELSGGRKGGLKDIVAIKNHVKSLLPHYMVPQKIVFVDAIPRNNSNKADRALLKKMASEDLQ